MFSGLRSRNGSPRRERLHLDLEDRVVYAIGDVHGCHRELVALERKIVADAASFDAPKLLILLGDYVDRGADSERVIEHLLAPPPDGFERICLAGNHDTTMLDYLDGRVPLSAWLRLGGLETLFSYGIDPTRLATLYKRDRDVDDHIRGGIPHDHVAFLRALPIMVWSARYVFVHAGLRPGVALEDQSDEDLLTIRSDFIDHADRLDRWVVHGHTRVGQPAIVGRRLGIDTGAYETGRLTAVRIASRRGRLLHV